MPLNKRKHQRVPIAIGLLPPAKMTLYKPFYHEPFDVEIQDLSAGGMKVLSTETLPLYFEFALEFELPRTKVIQAKAKAVHQVRTDGGYDIGVIFTEIERSIQTSLNEMAEDFQACEKRIRDEEQEICQKDCGFLNLCQKPQKIF